jgi:hypothetical protein
MYQRPRTRVSQAERIAFADESGTHGPTRCYGIGAVSLEADRLEAFNAKFAQLKTKHNLGSELNWEELHNRFSDINAILDWVDVILRATTATFDVIVVNTALYKNWSCSTMTREKAFYRTYTQLLTTVAKRGAAPTKVSIDERSDSYPRNNEVIELVGNRMLAQLAESGTLKNVEMVSSAATPGIQVADVLVGLIVAAHTRLLDLDAPMNPAKHLAIDRVATMFGWDHLFYDTMPLSKLNIWHFPIEWRAQPRTRDIKYSGMVPYVSKVDLRDARVRGKTG